MQQSLAREAQFTAELTRIREGGVDVEREMDPIKGILPASNRHPGNLAPHINKPGFVEITANPVCLREVGESDDGDAIRERLQDVFKPVDCCSGLDHGPHLDRHPRTSQDVPD